MAPQKWEQTLRRQIRDNHGAGWNVIQQSNKCKLTRRYEDGTKSAKVLPIEWKATNSVQILNAVTRVRQLVETRNVSVAEAVRLDTEALAVPEEHKALRIKVGQLLLRSIWAPKKAVVARRWLTSERALIVFWCAWTADLNRVIHGRC